MFSQFFPTILGSYDVLLVPDVGALVADLLLGHLEPAGPHAPGDHLLSAVTLPRAPGLLRHRLIVS